MEEYVGFFAAFCTTVSFLPQAIKVVMTKDTESISLWMYVIFLTGVCAWLAYGILTLNTPVIAANILTLVLAAIILFLKLKAICQKMRIKK